MSSPPEPPYPGPPPEYQPPSTGSSPQPYESQQTPGPYGPPRRSTKYQGGRWARLVLFILAFFAYLSYRGGLIFGFIHSAVLALIFGFEIIAFSQIKRLRPRGRKIAIVLILIIPISLWGLITAAQLRS